jgi:hypothetical protein
VSRRAQACTNRSSDSARHQGLRSPIAAKIFASLSMFLEEYRIGKEQSPLLLCAQSLVSRLDLMKKPAAPP